MTTVTERWVDPARIERDIEELAEFGARGETGVARLVYSPEWSAAQEQVAAWMTDAGLRVERDTVGNVWGYLDGTAKGGVLVALADRFGLPIHAIGVGEQIDDLAPFDPEEFAKALVGADG